MALMPEACTAFRGAGLSYGTEAGPSAGEPSGSFPPNESFNRYAVPDPEPNSGRRV